MYQLFPGHDEAVKRSQEIADGVDIQLDFKKRHFPVFTPPEGKTPEEYLRELCEEGLQRALRRQAVATRSQARLEHELGIICRMGFASYFLIVWDFVRFAARERHPGSGPRLGVRGDRQLRAEAQPRLIRWSTTCCSSASSTPTAAEAPDIDIDFCQDRREEVIAVRPQKYGEESASPRSRTFGTMAAKAAIKDVGRVLDVPLDRVNRLTKHGPQGARHHARRGAGAEPRPASASTTATRRSAS